jgi:hypothetical protein
LIITDFFLNQKKVNECEHMVKTAPCELQINATRIGARQKEGRGGNYLKLIPELCLEDRTN